MTQIIKKDYTWISPLSTIGKSHQEVKEIVLNYLFREICFVSQPQNIRALTLQEYDNINKRSDIPIPLIHSIISKFLINLTYFREFLRSYSFTYRYTKSLRKLQIYLHKLHQFAPIFDYSRAKENARILKNILERKCFLPQFSTQLAIVLFVTDLNDKEHEDKIIQTNLRVFCNCSAYAFHRTRNKLGLK
ncbi:MAG: hypothetical protein ACFFFT_09895 [Candidatus Thorarchaeota archaeon]